MSDHRIVSVDIDERALPTAQAEEEQRVAISDLLEENFFRPILDGQDIGEAGFGPFALGIALEEGRLAFDITDKAQRGNSRIMLSLSPLRQIIKDYFAICEAYFDAVKHAPPSRIEAVDMGRRGIHDEGARILIERLSGKVEIDHPTARRLFTLIALLHFRG